jgi:hypothetical protein
MDGKPPERVTRNGVNIWIVAENGAKSNLLTVILIPGTLPACCTACGIIPEGSDCIVDLIMGKPSTLTNSLPGVSERVLL